MSLPRDTPPVDVVLPVFPAYGPEMNNAEIRCFRRQFEAKYSLHDQDEGGAKSEWN
jgi:hypothetical protein